MPSPLTVLLGIAAGIALTVSLVAIGVPLWVSAGLGALGAARAAA